MALIQKDENDDLITLAARSNPIMFYATDAAAEDAYTNGEIPEGTIVITEEDAESDQWVDFTPYSTSGLTNISGMKRAEGGLVHYIITCRTTSQIATNNYQNADVRLYNTVPSGFAFKHIAVSPGNENAGRFSAYYRKDSATSDETSTLACVAASFAGNTGYCWLTFDIWATA